MNPAELSVTHQAEVPDDFLPSEPEGGDFYRAFARAHIPGLRCAFLTVHRQGQVVALVPWFLMDFNLGTMLAPGRGKDFLSRLSLRIACVGHPSADRGTIQGEASADVLAAVNADLARLAPVVCYKGFGPDLPLSGFARVAGLPIPVLAVAGDFWQTMSARRRRDLQRQLKFSAPLRFVESDGLPDSLVDRVLALYEATWSRSATQFERLNRGYFVSTAAISKYLLFFEGEQLIGFAQTLCGHGRMVHKYVGMDYERNRAYRLYFALFLRAIEICQRDGLHALDSGVTSYTFKRHLGSTVEPTWVYYRHRQPLANALLQRFAFLLAPHAAELKGLDDIATS